MWCVCVYLPLYLNMNIRWKREAITAFDRPQRNKWATNSDQFGHCRRPVQTNWGEREERLGFSDSWVKILARIRGWLWRSSGSSVFSCAQTIMANSSVHLFAMIDLIFGPLVGLREFGTSALCNRNCLTLKSLLFNLAQLTMIFNVERKGTKQFHLENRSLSKLVAAYCCLLLHILEQVYL